MGDDKLDITELDGCQDPESGNYQGVDDSASEGNDQVDASVDFMGDGRPDIMDFGSYQIPESGNEQGLDDDDSAFGDNGQLDALYEATIQEGPEIMAGTLEVDEASKSLEIPPREADAEDTDVDSDDHDLVIKLNDNPENDLDIEVARLH
jgi:hypothetical protein